MAEYDSPWLLLGRVLVPSWLRERERCNGGARYGHAELGGLTVQFLAAPAFLHAVCSAPSHSGSLFFAVIILALKFS